ncbi:Zinc finger protein [Trichinella pseudospiralis]
MDWKPFNCNVCGKSFSQQANLADHQNIHYGNRPFQCKQCKKTFNNRGAYYNHMRIHNDDRFYVCPLCNANFMWELSMKTHLYRHQRNGEISAKMAEKIYERTKTDVRLKKRQLKNAAREIIENYIQKPTKTKKNATSLPQNHQKQQATNNDDYNSKGNGIYNEVPNMKASEIPNYENLENWMCEASSTGTSTYANETSSHLLNERTPNRSNQNQFSEDITALNFHNYATNNGSEDSPQFKKENEARAYMGKNYYDTSFYEQPNASLYTKEESQTEYSPNLNRTYENNMANYIHEIPQNTPSQQQFNTQQPFHYTFGEQNNFQNVNALGIINDHAYNANYAYYQQNSPQETFNQQFIPQIEGNLYHENNLQAVYNNETADSLSNYWQPQISLPQETFNQQFIPEPKGNPNHQNNLQSVCANETVYPHSNYWLLQISYNQNLQNNNGYLEQFNSNEIAAGSTQMLKICVSATCITNNAEGSHQQGFTNTNAASHQGDNKECTVITIE